MHSPYEKEKFKLIVGEESPLRQLPADLNCKQTLFLDGIRYSVEMADLAHARLRDTLLRLAVSQGRSRSYSHLDQGTLLLLVRGPQPSEEVRGFIEHPAHHLDKAPRWPGGIEASPASLPYWRAVPKALTSFFF